ncbi:branched-chain amino acid ABC transporter permease [uncultured Dysosmobacter sp.]|uniref:branched-chain amino acid ABC transporter permease n=1 Tax=uncultured Dysosmobacter sp. TaxID=2591384 RepID=UPI0026349150|nr:branched-chain amino acid ABC transporter permease [uncultured Dysosmobacter sp.]
MKQTSIKARYLVNLAAALLLFALAVVIGMTGGSTMKLKITPSLWQCSYLIIMAASLNLVLGFLGQLSLGHCGFMAVGAYAASLFSLALQRAGFYTEKSGPAFMLVLLLSFLIAGASAALLGLLVGIPALRLKGDYLAIITLGFGMIIVNLINNLPFCGQQGLSQGSASSALYATGLGFSNDEKMQYLWVAALVVILCMTVMFMFVRSKYGRCIRAIRDNEIAAAASGINVSYYKVMTFTISAFFAGITGTLYACCNASLSTTSFAFTNGSILNSVFIVVMVVVGGMGSLTGSVIAAVVLFLLNYTIKNGAWVAALPAFLQNVFTYPMLVYSIALIVVIMFRPRGIMGSREFALCDIPKWPAWISSYFASRGLEKSAKKEAANHG